MTRSVRTKLTATSGNADRKRVTAGSMCIRPNMMGAVTAKSPFGSVYSPERLRAFCDRAAEKYRVIAFGRPGFGHSSRPRGGVWEGAGETGA